MKKYPKTIYVQRDGDGRDEWFKTEESINESFEDGKIAVYELKEVKTRRTEIHLE